MEAVHFGAGNIGRGFIAVQLNKSNYHTTFIDVNGHVIDEINRRQEYQVKFAAEISETYHVTDISGINSLTSPEQAVQAIAKADLITTAVGPNVLKIISKLVAQGLRERIKSNKRPLNLVACENMIGGSSFFKEKVYEHINEEERQEFDQLFGFPNAAVDRIVPNQTNDDPLFVSVEPYFEWVVEVPPIKGDIPPIEGVTYVNDLLPYIERKLFTVNTGHAVPAYMGYSYGYKTIFEAMNDTRINRLIKGVLQESGEALIRTYDLDREAHEEYTRKIIERFKNPLISDDINRVARGPIRKLGNNDRLIRPAIMYYDTVEKEPTYLAKMISAVMNYRNEEDEEAVLLHKKIENSDYREAFVEISGLDPQHPLVEAVMNELKERKVN